MSDITTTRRKRLATWLEGRTVPAAEKSYFSQLINGKTSFGEKAARRIERDYLMESGYLDTPLGDQVDSSDRRKELIAAIASRLETMPLDKVQALTVFLDADVSARQATLIKRSTRKADI